MTSKTPIAIFDSGVGGLTVAKEIALALPAEDIVYLGDTARVPYGTKSPATVRRFAAECVEFLLHFRPKLVVVACNTASATALDSLAAEVDVPLLGVIEPGARAAAGATTLKRVGVIGTRATVASGAYQKALAAVDEKIAVIARACPLFVPLVEEGWITGPVVKAIAETYLRPLRDEQIDALILGCTHYPVLKPVIREVMGGAVALIDSGQTVATAARELLTARGEENPGPHAGNKKFFVTDVVEDFLRVSDIIWPEREGPVERVEIARAALR